MNEQNMDVLANAVSTEEADVSTDSTSETEVSKA